MNNRITRSDYIKALQIINGRMEKDAGIKDILRSGLGYLQSGATNTFNYGKRMLDNFHRNWHGLKDNPKTKKKLDALKAFNKGWELLGDPEVKRIEAGIGTIDGIDRTVHAIDADEALKSKAKTIANATKDIIRTGDVKKYLKKGLNKAHEAIISRYPSIKDTEDSANILLNGPEKQSSYPINRGGARALLKQAMYKKADIIDPYMADLGNTATHMANAGKSVRTPVTMAETLMGAKPGFVTATGNTLGVPYMISSGVHDLMDVGNTNLSTADRTRAALRVPNDVYGTFGPIYSSSALPAALTYDFIEDTMHNLNETYASKPGNALELYKKHVMDTYTDPKTGVVSPEFNKYESSIIDDMLNRGEIIATGALYDAVNHGKELAKAGVEGYSNGSERVGHAMNVGKINPDIPHYYGEREIPDNAGEPGFITRIQDPNGRVHFYDFFEAMKQPRDRGTYISRLIQQPFKDISYMINSGYQGAADKRDAVGIQPEQLYELVTENQKKRKEESIEDQKRKNKSMEETDRLMRR